MNTHADKTQENKSQSVANAVYQNQTGCESTFQFVDNRPEAIAQRKLQEMANNSPQVSQLRAFQEIVNKSPQVKKAIQFKTKTANDIPEQKPIQKQEDKSTLFLQSKFETIQLMAAWDSLEKSESKYGIEMGNRNILYGSQEAASPKPSGLYSEETDNHSEVDYKTWKPNVVFASKDQRKVLESGASLEGRMEDVGADKEIITQNAKVMLDYTDAIAKTIRDKVDQEDGSPTTGVLGVNDCGNWANKLREMISAQLRIEDLEVGEAHSKFDTDAEEALPAVSAPGDQMTHIFNDVEDLDCAHHSATVVAVDGADLITLEAHASKDLLAPEFHVRQGLQGFITDNDTAPNGQSRGLGGKGHVAKASKSKAASIASLQRVQDLLNQYDYEKDSAGVELLQILNKFPMAD
jgi:hypothetical protein